MDTFNNSCAKLIKKSQSAAGKRQICTLINCSAVPKFAVPPVPLQGGFCGRSGGTVRPNRSAAPPDVPYRSFWTWCSGAANFIMRKTARNGKLLREIVPPVGAEGEEGNAYTAHLLELLGRYQ